MKIYLDYIFLVNFLFDFILLFGISIVLKRNISKLRLFLGSLFGGLSFFLILFPISSFLFFVIKMLLGLIMLIITFSYKNFKYTLNNFLFIIILSILLGGFLYFIDIELGYSHVGMLFFTKGKKYNLLILVICSLLLILFYTRYLLKFKTLNGTKYKCSIFYKNREYNLSGYLDTGNDLVYLNKPVLILNKNILRVKTNLLIPFTSLNGSGIMKGFVCNKLYIDGYGYFKKVIIGIANDKFHLEGADIILNMKLMEGKNENNKTNKKTFKN